MLFWSKRRQHHQQDSWACFLDLVRAFDAVNRQLLFDCCSKQGIPPHFINLLIRLHNGSKVQWRDAVIDSTIGVRQGSSEGPCLFLIMLQACLESMQWPDGVKKPTFHTTDANTGKVTGTKHNTKTFTKFEFWLQLFADDAAMIFESREDMQIGLRHIVAHLSKFGLTAHLGRAGVKSKTECMHFPGRVSQPAPKITKSMINGKYVTVTRTTQVTTQPATPTAAADTSDIIICATAGTSVHFTDTFKYLGSMLTRDLKSDLDIETRLTKATQAFGALRSVACNRHSTATTRGMIYKVMVISLLLHGAESWSLTEKHMRALTTFHRRCMRAMCNVNLRSTRNYRIETATLEDRLGVDPIDQCYHRRLFGWAGEVLRMPMDRLPRKLLTAWLPCKRAVGAMHNWGNTLNKALTSKGITTTFHKLSTLANQTTSKVKNDPEPASWLQSTNTP